MKYIPAIILGVLSGICLLAAKPEPGGVNANVIMLLPAGGFAVFGIVAALIARFV